MDSFLEKFFPAVYKKESSTKPSDDQYCKFDSQTLTLFTSSLYLAALVSSVFASVVTRILGRRITMLSGGILFLCGALVNAFAQQVWMLILGRLLLGFGIGCANQSVPIYVSEMAPYKYRGGLNMMFQLSITIGILAANILNYFFAKIEGGWGWRLSLGGAAVPAIIIIIGAFILPETPNSLIERNKYEEARRQLLSIRGVPNVDEEYNDMIAASEASRQVKHPWVSLLSRKYRPQLVFAIGIPAFQQLTGMNVITFYAPVLFKTLGFGNSASLMSAVITGSVNALATLVSIFTVDRVGRRKLFLEGGAQMFICQVLLFVITGVSNILHVTKCYLFITRFIKFILPSVTYFTRFITQVIIGIAIALKFGLSGNPGHLQNWYAYGLVCFICIYVAGFAWSWGPLGWLVPSEIFPLEVRSAAQSVNVSVNMIFTFAIAQVFTTMLCHVKFGLFLVFAACVVVMNVFIYKLLPETKGVPIEEMSIVWRRHPYWRKFVPEDNLGGKA